MIVFETVEVGSGWRTHSIPDELSIKLHLDTTEHEFYISVVDLVRIYSIVHDRKEDIIYYGTGGGFELEDIKNDFGFVRMPPICIGLPLEELEDALEDLLREVFEMCDETDGPKNREQEFPDIQRMLEKRDWDVDIRELYKRLSQSADG